MNILLLAEMSVGAKDAFLFLGFSVLSLLVMYGCYQQSSRWWFIGPLIPPAVALFLVGLEFSSGINQLMLIVLSCAIMVAGLLVTMVKYEREVPDDENRDDKEDEGA